MSKLLNLMLADDDADDRHFFERAIEASSIESKLTTAEDGEKLMDFLKNPSHKLPDVIFLDLNMPRKNGIECLKEIKNSQLLKNVPVIIYSTSLHSEVSDILYRQGAHFYIKKTDFNETKIVLHHVLQLLVTPNFLRPEKDNFILNTSTIAQGSFLN